MMVVITATARPIAPAPAKPTPALMGRRLMLVLSRAKLAKTASPSNTAQSPSTRPHASGVPSLPIAMPTVRLITQIARIARLPMMPAVITVRDGRKTISAASASWAHALTAKKRPWVHDAGVLAHHPEVDRGRSDHEPGDRPPQHGADRRRPRSPPTLHHVNPPVARLVQGG